MSCVIAVIIAAIVQTAISSAVSVELLALCINIAVLGLVYSFMLSAEYKKGVLISILSVILQIVIVALLSSLGIASGVVELET